MLLVNIDIRSLVSRKPALRRRIREDIDERVVFCLFLSIRGQRVRLLHDQSIFDWGFFISKELVLTYITRGYNGG